MKTFLWSGTVLSADINYADCIGCHQGIERISANHDFACAACHLDPRDRSINPLPTHEKVIRNPSDPSQVRRFCMPCHQREIQQLERSLHSTMAGIINQTRYLWGAQSSPEKATEGVQALPLPLPVPDPSVYPDSPGKLVDDFLRRRCLRCHIHGRGQAARGLYRATGCAACHVLYGDEGRYEGGDRTIDTERTGYPLRHEFTARIPTRQCLHCHNHNHVGTDYVGLFERDYSRVYRSQPPDEAGNPFLYGIDHHSLSRDVHAERGMWCVDCHGKKDVMGDGIAYGFQMAVPKMTCSQCHGGFEGTLPDPAVSAIRRVDTPKGMGSDGSGKWEFISKNGGNVHPMPLFSAQPVAHGIHEHRKLRCSACHAQWSYQDYGLSVIRIDGTLDPQWRHLTVQGDPHIERLLEGFLKTPGKAVPLSQDWVDGRGKRGIWLQGWRFRRWEHMPLGKDNTGRYAVLRPLHQYLVSYVDGWGNVPLDSVIPQRGDHTGPGWAFMPYVPHTSSPFGRFCDRCHQSPVAAGLGMEGDPSGDTRLTVPSPPAIGQMRLLNENERQRLLNPSERFRKNRLRALTGFVPSGDP